jgi:hypothetical protein
MRRALLTRASAVSSAKDKDPMSIKPVAISESTAQQRLDYVRNFLNLEISGTEDESDILSKINAAQPNSTMIFVNEPDTSAETTAGETAGEVTLSPEEATGRQSGTLGRGDPRAVIMIPVVETEDGSGARDVVVGVNGRGWQLKRGVDLSVPWRVVEALDNAVAHIVRHSQEEGREGEVIIHTAKRVSYQFIEKPTAAEIAAWHERTDALFCA